MKAYVLHGVNDLRFETAPDPAPGENEVLVAVENVGICGSDLPRIYRTGAHSHPLIPGHEFAGTVVETGIGADQSLTGKRAGVFPLLPCRKCGPCLGQKYELCRNYDYLGSRRDGGFAELAAVPEENLLLLPEGVSVLEAAMLEPMAVAVHAMRRGLPEQEKGQKTVAVCGLGTIGLFLLMFLKEAGFKNVLVFGKKEFQRKQALSLGVPEEDYCDIKAGDAGQWLLERTGGQGAEVFFECVGKNETVRQAVDGTAPEGRVVLVGNPASDMGLERDVYWKILRNQLVVTGTWNSSFLHDALDDWHYVLKRLAEKRIRPEAFISHRFAFDSLERGLHIMRDKTEDYGKVMIDVTGSF